MQGPAATPREAVNNNDEHHIESADEYQLHSDDEHHSLLQGPAATSREAVNNDDEHHIESENQLPREGLSTEDNHAGPEARAQASSRSRSSPKLAKLLPEETSDDWIPYLRGLVDSFIHSKAVKIHQALEAAPTMEATQVVATFFQHVKHVERRKIVDAAGRHWTLDEVRSMIDFDRGTEGLPYLWLGQVATSFSEVVRRLRFAKARTDDHCSPEDEEEEDEHHVALLSSGQDFERQEPDLTELLPFMKRENNSVTTLYLVLCRQWVEVGQYDHLSGMPMVPTRMDDTEQLNFFNMTTSARKVHQHTASYGFRTPLPSSWEDFNIEACNVVAELWITNMLREGTKRGVAMLAGVWRRVTSPIIDEMLGDVEMPLTVKAGIRESLLRERDNLEWAVNPVETGLTVNTLNATEAACVTRRLHGYRFKNEGVECGDGELEVD